MMERPTLRWRRAAEEQAVAVSAGLLTPEKAYAGRLWPAEFVAAADATLTRYDADLRTLDPASDEQAWAAVERVVTALNDVNDEHGRIETSEREAFAEYIDAALHEAGVDVAALTARRDLDRSELTDQWRDW
ncbi:hypothetical protein AWW66_17470 [Micromonospora rosaria]|uniref:Uncharacterized protein n=2 Tax=Micromonospora TaxID=1873 RepID=A0A136PQM6_9ACTN|nr:hypothetical protein [Micromonospora rosaria]KXK60674.1 hypothetical protein AWW66_17470 [Micromonospora rosaria]